jgi:hypothetical protein
MTTLKLPPPPVPQRLREMLKDYPEHIQTLQEDLIAVAQKRSPTPPFERAVWMLEDALSSFISEARAELHAAEASGDAAAIERAKAKELLMLHARSLHGLHDLFDYFQANKEAFE